MGKDSRGTSRQPLSRRVAKVAPDWSDDDSPAIPARLKTNAGGDRWRPKDTSELAESASLFQKMGIPAEDSYDSDASSLDGSPPPIKAAYAAPEPAHQHPPIPQPPSQEVLLLTTRLAAAQSAAGEAAAKLQLAEQANAHLQAEAAAAQEQVHMLRKSLAEQAVASNAAEGLPEQTELLRRQVAVLQASSERSERERNALVAEREDLLQRLHDVQHEAKTLRSAAPQKDTEDFALHPFTARHDIEIASLQEQLLQAQSAHTDALHRLAQKEEERLAALRRADEAVSTAKRDREAKLAAEAAADKLRKALDTMEGERGESEAALAAAKDAWVRDLKQAAQHKEELDDQLAQAQKHAEEAQAVAAHAQAQVAKLEQAGEAQYAEIQTLRQQRDSLHMQLQNLAAAREHDQQEFTKKVAALEQRLVGESSKLSSLQADLAASQAAEAAAQAGEEGNALLFKQAEASAAETREELVSVREQLGQENDALRERVQTLENLAGNAAANCQAAIEKAAASEGMMNQLMAQFHAAQKEGAMHAHKAAEAKAAAAESHLFQLQSAQIALSKEATASQSLEEPADSHVLFDTAHLGNTTNPRHVR